MALGVVVLHSECLFLAPTSFIHLVATEERRQCITIVYDDLLWNALVVERASKQFADCEFPVTRAATELMHDLRRKKSTTISPAL